MIAKSLGLASSAPLHLASQGVRRSSRPTLATTGFELVRHGNTVDLHNDHAEGPYSKAVEGLPIEHTRADKAIVFELCRRHTSIVSDRTLPGATDVHVDCAASDSRFVAARGDADRTENSEGTRPELQDNPSLRT